jgi:uncharacterized protein YdhG (YjbR/CyaY superfamily)
MEAEKYTSSDQYIQNFEPKIAQILYQIRDTIARTAPEAVDCIAYNMPAFKLHKKPLVYFAAFKNHIGFYALPSGHATFKDQLAPYKSGKGSVQFPLDQEIPYSLISQMVEFRVKEVKDSLSANNKD